MSWDELQLVPPATSKLKVALQVLFSEESDSPKRDDVEDKKLGHEEHKGDTEIRGECHIFLCAPL